MLYLVTGGAGFIGSHLVRTLAERGNRVRVLDNFDTGSREVARDLRDAYPELVEIIEGDIRDSRACDLGCAGADYVLHEAALASVPRSFADPKLCVDVIVSGTVSVLDAALKSGTVRRVVLASTCAVYASTRRAAISESARIFPVSPYASSKYAAELLCRCYARSKGMETAVLRYFNVYGVGQNPVGDYAAVIPKFLLCALHGSAATIYGDGNQVRDFVNVDDVVRANLLACEAVTADAEASNIGSGRATSLKELLAEISGLVPNPIAVRHEPARAGDIRRSVASIERARQVLGFEPTISLGSGLRKMLVQAGG